jgi:hypothetical protein
MIAQLEPRETTMTNKKPRGRPRGSEKDDNCLLEAVARLLVVDETMKPTTAIKRVIAECKTCLEIDPTLLRRLQRKWKERGIFFLTAARFKEKLRPCRPEDKPPFIPTDFPFDEPICKLAWRLAEEDSTLNGIYEQIVRQLRTAETLS